MVTHQFFGMGFGGITAFAPHHAIPNDMIAERLQEELQKENVRREVQGLPPLTEKHETTKYRTNDRWIQKNIGFKERRYDLDGLGTIGMAEKAARLLFEKTSLRPTDVDSIIFGTVTPSYLYSPPDATLLQQRLSIPAYSQGARPRKFFPVDVSQACSTWIMALTIAYSRIALGLSRNIILIGADTMSTTIDWTDRAFATVLGDAATAVWCRAVPPEEDWFAPNQFWSWAEGSFAQIIKTPVGGSLHPLTTQEELDTYQNRLWMDGAVVKEEMIPFIGGPAIQEAMALAGWSLDMIDLACFHEANRVMNQDVIDLWRQQGFRGEVLDAGGMFSNTTSASVALALALNGEKLQVGKTFNLNKFGGGFTAGNVMGKIKHPVVTAVQA